MDQFLFWTSEDKQRYGIVHEESEIYEVVMGKSLLFPHKMQEDISPTGRLQLPHIFHNLRAYIALLAIVFSFVLNGCGCYWCLLDMPPARE